MQEFPETPEEAFITSGDTFIDNMALAHYLEEIKRYEARNVVPV